MSSIRGRIGRPSGRPCQTFEVSPGHHTAMFSPIPRRPFMSWILSPSPKDSSMMMATVPQAMAATVKVARLRCSDEAFRKS